MKRSLIYILIAVLTIGVSATILSRLPGKEPEIKVQYDFNSIEEFEEYFEKDILSNSGKYHEIYASKVNELEQKNLVNIDTEDLARVVESSNTFFGIVQSEVMKLYLDEDILILHLNNSEIYLFKINDSKILMTDNIDKDFNLGDGISLSNMNIDDVLKGYLVYEMAVILYEPVLNMENQEMRIMEDVEIGKTNLSFISNKYQYSEGENASLENASDILGYGNLSINFESKKIELNQTQYDNMLTLLANSNCQLNEHQKSHILKI